ncbi:MAG: phosphonate ABC transporter, permease protein PhnE [Clostridia bacterium]|nr:phosphonate ABC transporter, permease protein PhnE [Clostridia bacterium]
MRKKQKAEAAVKTPLLDRLIPPREITLPNGHTVKKPVSRAPFIAVLTIAAIWISAVVTGFDFRIIIERGHQLGYILGRIFHPNWSYFGGDAAGTKKLMDALFDTIKMSIMGSVIGATMALPISVMASNNINRSTGVVWFLRILLMVIRTLPTLIIAKFAALIFGLGTFAGTVAIVVFTFGIVAKMMYESIETIDMGAFEATESFGANKFQSFWSACMPQILPTYLSYCLYSLEMNIRAAAILGYVGAGGLGILINEFIGWRDYESLGAVLLALFVVVLIIENTSQYLRKKLS